MATATAAAPVLQSLSPASGPLTGGTEVTITGTGFTGATAVLFGAVGAPPASVNADGTSLTVTAPAAAAAGAVDVQVNTTNGLSPKVPAGQFTYEVPAVVNALFVVDNQTGVPDELVFVKFLGAEIAAGTPAQTYGDAQALATGSATASKSYSLAEMTAQAAGMPQAQPVFQLHDFSGGRIYFSLGVPLQTTTIPAAQTPTAHDYHTVYGYVEPSIFPDTAAGNTNLDASYVDFVGIPVDVSIRRRADGSLVTSISNNPLTTPSGSVLFDALTGDTNVPAGAVVTADAQGTTSGGLIVAFGGTARILSPSLYDASLLDGAASYHGWTGTGSLIEALRDAGTSLAVASYVTQDGHASLPAGTLFGFSGSPGSSIGPEWAEKQSYDLTATALANLYPSGSNPVLAPLQGKPGIKLSGSGDVVGAFDVYLTDTDLDAQTGVYGANPPYVVVWHPGKQNEQAYAMDGIQNDLAGRVVGDLLAGFNFGWAGCGTTAQAQAQATGTTATLQGTVFDPAHTDSLAGSAIGALSTGQFFYLLSLQPTTADLAKWFGAGIQPDQPTWYNNYASDFQALTSCYNMAFTDRLQGPSDPDLFFTPADDTYVQVTLLPGAYTVRTTQL